MKLLTIGAVATATGVSADTLRYYEKMKLIVATQRSGSGYRLYAPDAVRIVRFIRGAKALSFTLDEISQMLALNASDQSTCAQMLSRTKTKIAEAETKIKELKEIKSMLNRLAKSCPGDASKLSACPIVDHITKGKKSRRRAAAIIALGGALLALAPQASIAKPISYVGGTMVMQENDETGHTVTVDYTVTPRYSFGLYAKRDQGGSEDFTTVGPQANFLLKRWNLPDGQGNIFNSSGVGVSSRGGHDQASAWTGILGDYETRRIFTSYEARFMAAGDIETSLSQRARVGVAPYKGGYDDLQPWLMLQVDHHPSKEDTLVATPLVRMFYKTTLVEAGYSSNNHVMFNWVQQF
jgi:DNA-binding transcriptional MerR regulator